MCNSFEEFSELNSMKMFSNDELVYVMLKYI